MPMPRTDVAAIYLNYADSFSTICARIERSFSASSLADVSITDLDDACDDFIKTLQDLSADAKRRIKRSAISQVAEEELLIELQAIQFLRHTIEDKRIDTRHIVAQGSKAIENLVRVGDWRPFLKLCHEVSRLPPIRTLAVDLLLSGMSRTIAVRAFITRHKNERIQVSRKRFPVLPNIDETLGTPGRANDLIEAFAELLEGIRRVKDVTALCFVEKSAGPAGALLMLPGLVERIGLPAFFYRETQWSAAVEFGGPHHPTAEDSVVIVYDLFVTGGALKEVASEIQATYSAEIAGAVVLFSYDEKRVTLEVGEKRFEVHALGSYAECEADVHALQSDRTKSTPRARLITNGMLEGEQKYDIKVRSAQEGSTSGRRPGRDLTALAEVPSDEETSAVPNEQEVRQKSAPDTEALAAEIVAAYAWLEHHRGDVVERFWTTFEERSRFVGLSESYGEQEGLHRVLSGLLRASPPAEAVEEYKKARGEPRAAPDRRAMIEKAVRRLAVNDQAALASFARRAESRGTSKEHLLGAIMLYYERLKYSYPF